MDNITPIVDWDQLRSLREVQADGEPDVVKQVITMFQEDSTARMARAFAALERGDAKALRLEAHSLRGTAGLIGAVRLRDAATTVERDAESGALATIRPLVDAMAAAVADVENALTADAAAQTGPAAATPLDPAACGNAEDTRLRILIADDDPIGADVLTRALGQLDVSVCRVSNGTDAWEKLQRGTGPGLAILDWMMPDVDGLTLCRRIRETPSLAHMYVIVLTSRSAHSDVVQGLGAGADDYLSKPFNADELRARVMVGARVLALQQNLAARVDELQQALAEVKQLSGLLPICSYCKRIRNDENYWEQVDRYIEEHSSVEFSHGICPPCLEREFNGLDSSAA